MKTKSRKNFWSNFVAGFGGGVIVFVLLGVVNLAGLKQVSPLVDLPEDQLVGVVSENAGAVVSIISLKESPDFFRTQSYIQTGGGTGFIVDENGLILTNKHILQDKSLIYRAVMKDARELELEIIGEDPFDDVAVLRIKDVDEKFPFLKLGDSDRLNVGQSVVAIGNALGLYENTVTSGIISAKGRAVSAFTDSLEDAENFVGLLQTDAAINPGNSGGPLLNMGGEVIGMNVAVAEFANGIGFAIPINDLKPIIRSVRENGEILRPVLGVRFLMLDAREAEHFELGVDHGALVIGNTETGELAIIKGSAADEAGLQSMDVILEVNGEVATFENPLSRLVRKYLPGDTLRLKVWRKGEIIDVKVVLKSNQDLQ